MLEQGMLVEGKYRILSEIGRGGMSVVYLAIVESANMTWAVKEVRKDGSNDYNTVRQGLIAEIDTLKSVRHSKLPRIVDVIEHEDNFIIVMDYIEGRSLDKILNEKGAQSEENVVKWAIQLCEVLGYLHSRPVPIIYRDMKPSNIMLKPDGNITIIDFGTAKKYEVSSGETTGLGTEGYAAPEQHGGLGRTDERTDIYALGMTMYALLTGVDPQKKLVINTSIREINPALSEGLDEIIRKCTQREKELRYKSCAELSYALEHYLDNDEKNKKKKKRKVAAFVSTFLLSVILAAGSLVLNLYSKSLAGENYEELLQKAAMTLDNEEKLQLYEDAISINDKGGDKRAYLDLINAYINNDGDEPVLTQEEYDQLNRLIMNNVAALESNPDDYIEVCYATGNLIWYYYYDTNLVTKSSIAITWFEKVNVDENDKKYGLAYVYKNIGIFNRDYTKNQLEGKDSGTYLVLFKNMNELVDKMTERKDSENSVVLLELSSTVQTSLFQYAQKFQTDGVQEEEIMQLYDKLEALLEDIPVANDKKDKLYIKKQSIKEYMKDTLKSLETVYKNVDKKE